MRLFVAVEMPEDVREVIAAGLGQLRRDQPPARWVRPEQMHFTLKFLGEQPDTFPDSLDRVMPTALAALPRVVVRLTGGGFFPNGLRPRVAWAGGEAAGFELWAEAVDVAAASLGVAREARPYSLHLTLARLDRPWGAQAVDHFRVEVGKWRFPEREAREVVLFRSELQPSGPAHTTLRRWRVGADAGENRDGA